MRRIRGRDRKIWDKYISLWGRLTGWRSFLFFAAHYTALFLIMSWFVFSDFREGDRTFIWTSDGMPMYFSSMVHFSLTVRDGIQSLLSGDGWTIPLYDFWIGTAKTLLEMEPIQWLAALWPWDRIDVLYDILVLLRYYLAGLSFSALGYYFKQRPFPILIGAVSYTFCGYSLYGGVRHPQFLAPMIFLPLLVIGAEKVLKKERTILLIILVFLVTVSSLYRACMLAIVVFLYAMVRFFALYPKGRGREFLGLIGRLAVSGGVGIALGGAVVVPTLLQMLDTGRIGRDVATYTDMVKYPISYYENFLSNFMIPKAGGEIGYWTCLGFTVLALPAIFLLFLRRDERERSLRRLFLLSTAMLLCPAVAYVLSGFNTLSNRWCFAYALCICAIVMFQVPYFEEMDRATIGFLGVDVLFYILICYVALPSETFRASNVLFLSIATLLIWLCWYLHQQGRRVMLPVCLLMTCMTICYGASLEYAPEKGNYIATFTKKGAPYQIFQSEQYGAFSRSEAAKLEQPFYRVVGDAVPKQALQSAFYYGIHGLSSYSSLQYPSFMQWLKELEMPRKGMATRLYGLRSRAHMLTLSGVKYYMMREREMNVEPYGFREIERIGADGPIDSMEVEQTKGANARIDAVLENQYALPLGYTYDSYLSREAYEKLPVLDKQNAQIQAVVLEEAPASAVIAEAGVRPEARKIPVTVASVDGVSWKDGKLRVKKEGATLILEFAGLPQTETYLRVVGLDLTSGASKRYWNLIAATESTSALAQFAADGYVYSNGMKTQTLHLGYTEDGFTTCTLTFPKKGTFKLEDLEIWCQPMDHYGERIDALREETLENVETNWRGVTGTISVSRDKMLCIAIPYDSGWSAYVDGQRVKLYQANTAFMAVELSPGDHQIELKYWTPGLTAGILLTCVGAAGLIVLVVWQRKDRKKAGR